MRSLQTQRNIYIRYSEREEGRMDPLEFSLCRERQNHFFLHVVAPGVEVSVAGYYYELSLLEFIYKPT